MTMMHSEALIFKSINQLISLLIILLNEDELITICENYEKTRIVIVKINDFVEILMKQMHNKI